jgi:Flp pilus assembly protein CpaB
MKLTNRFLLVTAALSGIAVVFLTIRSPLRGRSVEVLHASRNLVAGDVVEAGVNAEFKRVSAVDFASHGEMITAASAALLGPVRLTTPIAVGQPIATGAMAHFVTRETQHRGRTEASDITYVRLSGLLEPGEAAVAVNVNELGSFAYALEPDDRVDIVLPGPDDARASAPPFTDVRVLAVGARTAKGWATVARRREEFSAMTLLFDTVSEAQRFAQTFAAAPSGRAVVVLRAAPR